MSTRAAFWASFNDAPYRVKSRRGSAGVRENAFRRHSYEDARGSGLSWRAWCPLAGADTCHAESAVKSVDVFIARPSRQPDQSPWPIMAGSHRAGINNPPYGGVERFNEGAAGTVFRISETRFDGPEHVALGQRSHISGLSDDSSELEAAQSDQVMDKLRRNATVLKTSCKSIINFYIFIFL